MSKKNIRWLAAELPKFVERKLISQDQQHAILDYYRQEKGGRPNVAIIAFSIFGAVLLAAGIILILAHNWSNLSRPARTVLSFFPLVIGQSIGFWVLFRHSRSIAWREGIAAFAFLAVGSTIALISQTYHIQGELKTFLLTWIILALPLAYVFSSTTATVLYLAGISTWAVAARTADSSALAYWLLLIAILPMFLVKNTGKAHPKQTTIIGWFISLSLIAGVSVGHSSITEGFRTISFISMFLILYMLGSLFDTGRSIWSNPFHRVGILGLAVTCLFLSYRDTWDNLSYHAVKTYGRSLEITAGDWIVSIALPILAAILTGLAVWRKNRVAPAMAAGLPLALLGFAFTGSSAGRAVFTAIFNAYVFAGGVACMAWGIKTNEGKIVNFGFALAAAVIVLRFFDSDLSFVLRGIIFVILGAGFLSTNVFIARRRAAQ